MWKSQDALLTRVQSTIKFRFNSQPEIQILHLLKRLLQAQKGGLIKAFHTEWNYVVILGSDTPQNRRYFNTPLV